MTADLVVGAALVPVAALSLREVRARRELPFAMLPALFAAHQFLEIPVWLGLDGHVSAGIANLAMRAYLLIAWPLLPIYLPVAVFLLAAGHTRRRLAPFIALGAVVALYLAFIVLANPVEVIRHPHGIEYVTVVAHPLVWAVLYAVAVIAPLLLSGYRSVVVFGVLNLVGLVVVAVLYFQVFTSLWCVFAAASSLLVLVHMIRRRRLPDDDRLRSPQLSSAMT